MRRATWTTFELVCTFICALGICGFSAGCAHGANVPATGIIAPSVSDAQPSEGGVVSDRQSPLAQGTSDVDSEQREYARVSRERLRAIEARAQDVKLKRQNIPPASQGDVAATLNLLPSQCDETERDIDALETIASPKWQQRKHLVDRKLATMERSVDRMQGQ
jgi:hypothetical protein